MQEQIEVLKAKAEQAQKILVGIGEEFADAGFEQSDIYKCYQNKSTNDASEEWMLPFLKAYYLKTSEADDLLKKAYENLAEMLEGKDYFVVTLQNDDRIHDCGIDGKRIVSPRGSFWNMQCSDNCTGSVTTSDEVVNRIANEVLQTGDVLSEIERPCCNECGKAMVLNLHPQDKYCENGYLEQWQEYQKWVGGTLNRETLFLEAGAGFVLPNIIRWPFEKAVYLNNKAFLYRIHQEFWQLSAEVGEKGCSVKENSVKFLANL